jgi:tRNA pseudouridine13 synthase
VRPRGRIKKAPEDFLVDEIPAYEPSGEGSHLYIHFRKSNLTTDEAVGAFARALDLPRREIGVAGLKDKIAITTQWISLPANDPSLDDRVRALSLDGIEVLEAKRHGNKLRTGHLRGNRFTIAVHLEERSANALAVLERIGREGVPNAFGAQRFGKFGDTAERGRAWLTGKERAPSDPRLRRFHFSAVQSEIFNAVLAVRVENGTWRTPLMGDLLKKEESGGMFVCTDVQLDRERADRGEVCPTGPIVGDRMRQPENEAFDLEQRIVLPLIEGIDLKRARALGEGTRRPLVLRVTELSVAEVVKRAHSEGSASEPVGSSEPCILTVRFVLPKGAYATTVLSNAFEVIDNAREDARTEEE